MIHTRLNEWPRDRFRCSVDPITLTGLALAGLAGGGAAAATGALSGGGGQTQATPTPVPTAQQAVPPAQQPQSKSLATTGNQPTFIGAAATPPTQSGQKTLLGQ